MGTTYLHGPTPRDYPSAASLVHPCMGQSTATTPADSVFTPETRRVGKNSVKAGAQPTGIAAARWGLECSSGSDLMEPEPRLTRKKTAKKKKKRTTHLSLDTSTLLQHQPSVDQNLECVVALGDLGFTVASQLLPLSAFFPPSLSLPLPSSLQV